MVRRSGGTRRVLFSRLITRPAPQILGSMNESNAAATGQVTSSAAEIYESFFVPALFGQWPDRLLDIAGLSATDDVLDVGCGTGVLARAAAHRLGDGGTATGLDANEGMLAVAERSNRRVGWQQGTAEDLPFPDHSFDQVFSQFALMFFTDTAAAIDEMTRVTRPGGRVTIATWAGLDQSPGYAAMTDLLQRLFGDDARNAMMAPFTLGTEEALRAVIDQALPGAEIVQHPGTATFQSLEEWVHTDVRGWTLADMIDETQYQRLLSAAAGELAEFVGEDGRISFAAPALIASARVPASGPPPVRGSDR